MSLERKIEKLLIEDANFVELEKEFDQYCPFEALGMIRSEIRHGNYLAYLLNPARPHGFNTEILRAFLMCVSQKCILLKDRYQLNARDVHLMDIEQAEVRREWRNIDLLIVLKTQKVVVAIELKIDASQSHDQLERYRKIIEQEWRPSEGWEHINVFLTKHKENPNDIGNWEPLLLKELVEYLQVVADQPNDGQAAEMLRSYLRMLRRHHLEDTRLEEIAQQLWTRHSEALTFLADRRPDKAGDLLEAMKSRKEKFLTDFEKGGIKMLSDSDTKTIVRFAFQEWDALPEFKNANWTESKRFILLELKRNGSKIDACLYLGRGDESIRQKFFAILEGNPFGGSNIGNGRDWTCLAKQEIYNGKLTEVENTEHLIEAASFSITSFAKIVFEHYNPLLQKLT